MNRGHACTEVLKQTALSAHVSGNDDRLYAATNGFADGIPVDKIDWERPAQIHWDWVSGNAKDITANNRITPETESTLKGAIEAYMTSWNS